MAYMIMCSVERLNEILKTRPSEVRLVSVIAREVDEAEFIKDDPHSSPTSQVRYTGRKLQVRELYFEELVISLGGKANDTTS